MSPDACAVTSGPGAPANTNVRPPLRLRVPGLLDVLLVSDPEQIKWLNEQPALTRQIDPERSWLHRFIAGRLLDDLAFHGKLLPVFLAQHDAQRAERQQQLFERLQSRLGEPSAARDEIAAYVCGRAGTPEIGVLAQQWCGQLFTPQYKATPESYKAGRLIAGWASAAPWRAWADRLTGKLARAKGLLWQSADADLHCIHATSIGMENIAKTLRGLRRTAQTHPQRSYADALRACLAAPPAVLRFATRELAAPFLDQPLSARSIVVLLVARAYARSGSTDVAFLADGWSACPARHSVPELLQAAWRAHEAERAALGAQLHAPHERGSAVKPNGWGRSRQGT